MADEFERIKRTPFFFNEIAKEDRTNFLQMASPKALQIGEEDGRIRIDYQDPNRRASTILSDMVVLAPAMEGTRNLRQLSRRLGAMT